MIKNDYKPNKWIRGNLYLADGSVLQVTALDEKSAPLVADLISVMQLQPDFAQFSDKTGMTPPDDAIDPHANPDFVQTLPKESCIGKSKNNLTKKLLVQSNEENSDLIITPGKDDNTLNYLVMIIEGDMSRIAHLIHLSNTLAMQIVSGVLIHGALAEWQGKGVLLTGPSGSGKTTVSKRLKSPWHSLSDDATLIVRDGTGDYWAHPWPTWSNLYENKLPKSWKVSHAVPLKGIFFLSHADHNQVLAVEEKQAINYLNNAIEALSWPTEIYMAKDEKRTHRLNIFEKICKLVHKVPSYQLNFSNTGTFWQEIEQTLQLAD